MKLHHMSVAALAAVSLLCSSCVYGPGAGYGTVSYSTDGYNSSVAWTSASYDANGFPIFGYSYGRPVYGYTEAGVAIFTIAALTALCFVPHWKPAPWYHGHWHYPAHIHRVARPPHFPAGHQPWARPAGGMNAPIHRNPGAVFKPHNNQPGHRAGVAHQPGRTNLGAPGHHNRSGNLNRMAPNKRPEMRQRANTPAPRMNHQPNARHHASAPRPAMGNRTPQVSRSAGMNRPNAGSRSSGISKPAMGGARPSGGQHGHGGHRR